MIDQETHEYAVSVVAAIFFDEGPWWLRYHEKNKVIRSPRRKDNRTGSGDRSYTLRDVENVAAQLLQGQIIDRRGYRTILARVEAVRQPIREQTSDRRWRN